MSGLVSRPESPALTKRTLLSRLGGMALATGTGAWTAACGAGSEATAPATREAVAIEYWSQRAPADRLGLGVRAALDEFVARNPNRVSLTVAEGGAALSMEKIKASLAAGTQPNLYGGLFQTPAADLFSLGALLDINAELKSNKDWAKTKGELIPAAYEGCTWKGKLAMMPMMLAQQVLGINKRLMERAGVPLPQSGFTFAQFLDFGRKVAQPPDVALFPFNYTWSALNSWIYANGQVPLSSDRTKIAYDTPQMIETLQWLHDQVNAGWGRNGAADFDQAKSVTESVNEAAAMQPPRFPNLDPGDGSGIHVTHFPFGPSNTRRQIITYANNYGLVAFKVPDTKKVAAAAEMAGFGGRADAQTKIAEASGHPPSNTISARPENLPKRIKDNVILNLINDYGKYAYLTPNFPSWTNAMNLLQENLKKVASGDLRPRDALADAQPKIQQLVTEDLQRG
jgi:ABC-type glycerol-3-phosphate transport system substrate-binding protein